MQVYPPESFTSCGYNEVFEQLAIHHVYLYHQHNDLRSNYTTSIYYKQVTIFGEWFIVFKKSVHFTESKQNKMSKCMMANVIYDITFIIQLWKLI